jgi:UDP-N-acetylglucosamine/UDP-N-acetylgalactosamine diphosphorylase
MIKFKGYEKVISRTEQFRQEHVFSYWSGLNTKERRALLEELSGVDFELMRMLYEKRDAMSVERPRFSPAPYIALPKTKDDKDNQARSAQAGIKFIKKGKTAALLVAGGQGTRLGFDGPKGMFPVGPVSGKTLFRIHAEKILKYSEKYGISIPWLIMTSRENHDDTVSYFEKNKFFGMFKRDVIFFTQNMIPSLDNDGRLILNGRNSLSMNPDGHGGTLTALSSSGALGKMKKRGIELLSYFQVDNPLVKIIDPLFIGYHVLNKSDVSSKGVMKASPEEKVGVLVKFESGTCGIMEYSDLSAEEQNATDEGGNLIYCMGNPAIHLFSLAFIEKITSGGQISLPYHLARKKIEAWTEDGTKKIDGLKFEKFIFDALTLTGKNTVLEIKREEEFAPVKNAEGVDSPFSAKELMSGLYKKWLAERNIKVPESAGVVEISPLVAVEPEDLKDDIALPSLKNIYIDKK